jgi:class 3 adenylate cyclase/tetratricopeptide (TPR) repeat protein
MGACSSCGAENRDGARFCDVCGAALSMAPPPLEVRKTVTVVFCDVTGSTALGGRLDPEALRRVMSLYFAAMTGAIERHGGTVEKFIGDAVMAVFGIPTTHEDDALRAVRAAADMRDALELLNKELERDHGATLVCRIGVNTGEVVAGDVSARQALVTGDAVNVAARLEQAATPGEVLISGSTLRLVRDAAVAEPVEPLTLKGKSGTVPAHRLVEVHAGAPGVARRLDSPLVGRDRQLAQLRQAFEEVVSDRVCHLFTILGAPGVGKSRLVQEAIGELGDTTAILSGRCLSYGEGITYWPLVEIVRDAVGLQEPGADLGEAIVRLLPDDPSSVDVASRVAQLAGEDADVSIPAEEIGWAVRRFLEGLARTRPVVVVLDDLQWAEPRFLELVDQVSDWSRDAPILLICMARPDLLDSRPDWGGGKLHATTAALEPLSPDESERLVVNLLGDGTLDRGTSKRILGAAEGNPLFVEETIAMLVDDGVIRRDEGRWAAVGELAEVTVPPTIQALLAARLDRLDEGARAVLGRAAVVGEVFYPGAVREISPERERPDVLGWIQQLMRRDLVRPDTSDITGEDAFRFHHGLLRDAAYQMLPKETRADLHERFAEWLATRALPTDADEFVGYHLETAHKYLTELGPEDARARRIGDRAAELLGAAAIKARDRADWTAAESLGRRAVALRGIDDPHRTWDLLELGYTLMDAERVADAAVPFAEALEAARRTGDERAEAHASLGHVSTRWMLEPEGGSTVISKMVDDLIPRLELWKDDRGLAFAYFSKTQVHWNACRFALGREEASKALAHAEAAGDTSLVRVIAITRVAAAQLGASTAPELLADALDLEARAATQPMIRSVALITRADAAAMTGHGEEAQALAGESFDLVTELLGEPPIGHYEVAWDIATLCNDHIRAEEHIRLMYERLDEVGDVAHRSTAAGHWATTCYHLERFEDARRLAAECRDTSASDDVVNQVLWRGVEAKLHAREGSFEDAERLARDGIQWAENTDMLLEQAEAHADLAEVYRMAGRADDARAALEEAIDRASRKGATAVVDRLQHALDDLP